MAENKGKVINLGKLIVIEGTDGSGKATQTGLLCKRLDLEGHPARRLEFPRYDKESSSLVRLYLAGAFGEKPDDVNAYAASTFFAVDRFASYKEDWEEWYLSGGLVVTDRYTTSNAVHQAPKLPESERQAFLDWLFDFEYRLMGIPSPDIVIYLDMPIDVTEKMLTHRRSETGERGDIHENNEEYLQRCRQCALQVAGNRGWRVVRCAEFGRPRPAEDIHREIYSAVEPLIAAEKGE